MTKLRDKVQNALDEGRLLILGTQVLLGFQYRASFESGFETLPVYSQRLKLGGLICLLLSLALLIWPGAYHRIVARGEDSEDVHDFTGRVMQFALVPFAAALTIDLFTAAEKVSGTTAGIAIAISGGTLAMIFWGAIEFVQRRGYRNRIANQAEAGDDSTELRDKIEHVLTETKVALPGAQALLGFQFITILTEAFDRLPVSSKYVHLASLCLIAVSIILLMTTPARHRIVERGNETEEFHTFASRMLLAAMIPMALGLCGDFFVVARKITGSASLALVGAVILMALFYGLWFGLTGYWRVTKLKNSQRDREKAG